MKTVYAIVLLAAAVLLLVPDQSGAIPAFARKYGFNCNMCHVAFIKLNDFGQRFRDNGYQIPGQVGGEKNVFDTYPPLAIRTTTGFSLDDVEYSNGHKLTTDSFGIFGFDFLSAGLLHKNVSFLLIYTPRIDEPAADASGPGDTGDNPSQLATLESVNLVFSNLVPDLVNLRVGRFEPAYHQISSKRSYYLLQPYEVYSFCSPLVDFCFDDNQMGIEATGHCKRGCKYGLGVVNGNGANPDNNKHKDVYLSLSKTMGKGDGQSAGQRVGAFGYYGWQPLGPMGYTLAFAEEEKTNANFYRIGGAASLNWKTLNLQAVFLHGNDDRQLNPMRDEAYKYSGGFAELDCAALLDNRLVASALYNWVTPPDYDSDSQIKAYSGLVRYYMGDWSAVNVALHAEFTHREVGKDDPTKENQFALVLDFDF